jgi:hypothetical protein
LAGVSSPKIRIIGAVALFILGSALIINIARHSEKFQWDFKSYYYAAAAHEQQLNPYEMKALAEVSGKDIHFAYVYPPVTLWMARMLTVFPYRISYQIWLFLKIALLIALVYIWKTCFLAEKSSVLLYIFIFFAFDAAVYWDFKTGNISIIEQFLLWSAFLFFLKNRPLPFCLLILLISVFKATLIVFVVLLPFSDIKFKWWYCIGSFLVFGTIIASNFLFDPSVLSSYYGRLLSISREGPDDFNFTTLVFIKDIINRIRGVRIGDPPSLSCIVIYGAVIISIIGITIRSLGWRNIRAGNIDRKLLIFLACVIYVLIVPRLKCYSYIMLIAPGYYIVRQYVTVKALPYIILLIFIPNCFPWPYEKILRHFWLYYPLYLGYMIWILYLSHIRNHRKTEYDRTGSG